jgi:hypothetical protein
VNTRFTGRGLCLPLSKKSKASIATHAVILPALVQVGVDCGYAVALHGSLRRDLDLIAVPWVKWAVPPKELVERLARVCHGKVISEPSRHPHGRLSFEIHLGEIVQNQYNSDPYIDIGVFAPWEQPAVDADAQPCQR